MKIAFDLRRIKNPGIGRYMKCLVEAVVARAPEHEYLLILPPDANGILHCPHGRVQEIVSSVKYYSLREQIELPRILRRYKIDLLHSPHFNMPLASPCPVIATLHDVIYLACPEDLPSRLGRGYYRVMMEAAVRRADRIITVSEFSRREILRYLNAGNAEVEVIHSGVDPLFTVLTDPGQVRRVLERHGITTDYVLYAGIYKPRKNHAGLIRAFACFLAKGAKGQLVIAGALGEGERELRALATELGIASRVVLTGFVDDCELRALYSGASAYACPSLYEGFGFTVLEAMACGAPVVSSPETSLPEVAGEAALYADARDAEEFGAALYRVFTDQTLRERLIPAGRTNLQRFNWADAAERTVRVYEHVLGAPAQKAVCA
ncbi:MAG TPA: glycosyltransferase family 1 protein [Candidatus Angelobacter sp.]